MDALLLSRIQFAANISFHILFPTINIALCWFLVYFRLRHSGATSAADKQAWEESYYLWTKVFALSFALGVVSGITMSFQFGTNWPGYMERAGNIAGPLLGYEVLTAFFLEATFLGIMLFGRGRVSDRVHLFATLMVALGTTLSAFWILSLNSWMQTPAGYKVIDGVMHAESWWAIVFNPSFPYRLTHKLLASTLTAAFLIAGLSAWQILRKTDNAGTHKALRAGVIAAAVAIPLQMLAGDMHGLNTLEHQPAKIAAIEGLWETEKSAGLTLFGLPNEKEGVTHYAVKIPKLASLILAHDINAELKGLDQFPGEHPPVAPVFWSFRVMVGMGVLMLGVSWWAAFTLWRRRRQARREQPAEQGRPSAPVKTVPFSRWQLRLLAGMTFSGWVATLAGWYVTEIGRQPYIVYGLLRTADVVAPHAPGMVLATLIGYLAVYAFLLVAYILVLMYMAQHPAMPTPEAPQAPKAAEPVGGPA
ncbi:cytochrome ubiquinol oxidase subunit I [Ramlibacter tataouinensis]|uniref:Cytochrome d ubiquinol oxidase subunit I-like protein n=1 Tax=Ramlibacter tataouinensis (strain ATCC BAA-407 / DSM 14655 / LMG 21543 / TTB310) TaxID=365046 RepID=F5Y2R6_RAMTT|nr:cytochrome ubiquinol oxidase subunit I [Ramlibacter tataouinensis]AEG93612.1 cytochrome d ubiquinol oxidase subunit I-like protein [Ramlibacter tataouinensis TTB310]